MVEEKTNEAEEKKEPEIESTLEMKQDDVVHLSSNCSVVKVSGGWIYVFYILVGWVEELKKYSEVHISHTQFVQDTRDKP